MWIFGYGSLLWHQNFPYERVIAGVVKGYERKFWQLSPDHRGTESAPGRTVTLVRSPNATVFGLAFLVPAKEVEKTREYLDLREKAGYEMVEVEFEPQDGSPSFPLNVYIAKPTENIYFAGPSTTNEIVDTIIQSVGQSGSNLEYALRLAVEHRKLAPAHHGDDHLFEIETRLLEICERRKHNDKILRLLGYKLSYLSNEPATAII